MNMKKHFINAATLKTKKGEISMKKYLVTAATLLAVGLIAGCGSGTGTPTTSASTSVTGKVADGYLVNATVFMDKNGNYMLDAGEPSTTTDANGAYMLTIDPADMGKYPIVALATKGMTIDMDNPTQTITNSYVLSMPKNSVSGMVSSNFISPMSTQLREMMETGKYATMQDAMNALSTKLGMPAGTNMLQDYMAANHVGMHTAAQNIANIMGTQMAQVMGGAGGAPTAVQVNRYRGMMGAIFSNMSTIRGADAHTNMPTLMNTITNMLGNMPMTTAGQPYRNMSTAFRGGGMGLMGH
jgi:hypothetical protein